MRQHRKTVSLNSKKKDSFFYHSPRPLCARIIKELTPETIKKAESFSDRDQICRLFAAEAYQEALNQKKNGKMKVSLQYAKLAARLLNLSLRPKRLSDLEEIKKALSKLQTEGGA